MNEIMRHPVLAVGVEDILPIIFVLIGIVSWIMNALKEKAQADQRAGRPPVQRAPRKPDDSLQNEIDIFLQEVTGQRSQPKPQPKPRPATPPAAARPKRSRSQTPAAAPKPQPQHIRPGEEISSRKGPGSGDLGAGLTRHVEERMLSHSLRRESEQRLGHDVDASVAAHLGASAGTASQAESRAVGSSIAQDVRRMLSNPRSAAHAILLNEILSPPRSRRS